MTWSEVKTLAEEEFTSGRLIGKEYASFLLGALQKSTLLKKLNAGDYAGAADQFKRWIYADGVPLHGLEIRRDKERALFLKAVV